MKKQFQLMIFLGFLSSSIAFSSSFKIKSEHLDCKKNDDCVLVLIFGCCGPNVAVNKKFAKMYEEPVDKQCFSMDISCGDPLIAVCENKKCTENGKK